MRNSPHNLSLPKWQCHGLPGKMCYDPTQAILRTHLKAKTCVSQILTSQGHSRGSATPWQRSPLNPRRWHYHWRDPMLCPVQALCGPPPRDGLEECALPKEITSHYCVLNSLFPSSPFLASAKLKTNLWIFSVHRKRLSFHET